MQSWGKQEGELEGISFEQLSETSLLMEKVFAVKFNQSEQEVLASLLCGSNQREIGEELNLTESRISQIKHSIIKKIRDRYAITTSETDRTSSKRIKRSRTRRNT